MKLDNLSSTSAVLTSLPPLPDQTSSSAGAHCVCYPQPLASSPLSPLSLSHPPSPPPPSQHLTTSILRIGSHTLILQPPLLRIRHRNRSCNPTVRAMSMLAADLNTMRNEQNIHQLLAAIAASPVNSRIHFRSRQDDWSLWCWSLTWTWTQLALLVEAEGMDDVAVEG